MKGLILMINIIAIVLIYGILIEEMRILTYKDKLRIEKENRKRANEWFDYEREFIKESAILGERLRVSNEEFMKTCEEFQKQCEVIKHE
ncbi:hypothetical protein HF849_06130 [Clostridium beijerinckii]|uniref:Uncharacterized protein n=2 Tax=Clostridium beijerinckii TaxID=1520 RepID=A0A7X9XNM6_CLOBE|nr:hypothetical protein [Clostridium beijerinckii]